MLRERATGQGFDLFHGYLCQRIAHNYYPTHLWHNGRKLMLEGNAWFSAHQRIEEPLASDDKYYERFAAAQYAPAGQRPEHADCACTPSRETSVRSPK